MRIGTTELITILAIGTLLFGASAIPKLARSVGEAKKEFEKGVKNTYNGGKDDKKKSANTKTKKKED